MDYLPIVIWLLRLLGFVSQAEKIAKQIEAKERAQEIANAPKTKAELIDILNHGDL